MEIPISFKYDTVLSPSPRDLSRRRIRDFSDPPNPNRIALRPEPETAVRYRECQRNHAAHTGNRILDGCGEFMPNGDLGTPESMRCAACECHRNFHRKEIGGGMVAPAILHQSSAANQIRYHAPPRGTMMMAFGGGVHAESSNDQDYFWLARSDGEGSRKRMRTKFTEEQKEKMMEFAERIGWRIRMAEDDQVDKFCEEVGVRRQVFKVWMHNNKQAIKRKSQSQS